MSLRAVVFDISGTVLDYGSRAPVRAFVETFRRRGVTLSEEEARRPMGAEKRDHLLALLRDESIGQRWRDATGREWTEADVDELYREFAPIQMEVLPAHCDVIPGVPELTEALRARGLKIANTTGFARALMRDLIPAAEAQGYRPDLWMTPDEVGAGRPAPWMIFEAARRLNVYPMSTIVKVGDTPVDVAEAHAAGVWSVSVIRHGNEIGLSRETVEALPEAEWKQRSRTARTRLLTQQPHFIIDRTADLLPVLDDIERRLREGEKP